MSSIRFADPPLPSEEEALDAYGVIDGPTALHHVTVEGNGSRPFAGVRIHRARTLDPADVRLVRGLPMSTPARAILDAATGASVPQVRRLIREAEYRKLIGVGAIADVVRRNPFHPGSAIVRRADPRTAESGLRQTPIEDRMALVLNRLSLDAPQSQFPATGRSGSSPPRLSSRPPPAYASRRGCGGPLDAMISGPAGQAKPQEEGNHGFHGFHGFLKAGFRGWVVLNVSKAF